jgi:hypothetical protein
MKRVLALALASGALMLLSTAFTTAQAMAATAVPVSMTFTEPLVPGASSGCNLVNSSCGHGQVRPFGQATEVIQFGGACNGSCDLRTINLASGSVFVHEVFSNPTCPGVCQPNPSLPGGGTLTDVIVGGTGQFADASGNLSGSVTLGGGVGTRGGGTMIKLSGTITLAP